MMWLESRRYAWLPASAGVVKACDWSRLTLKSTSASQGAAGERIFHISIAETFGLLEK